MTDRMDFIKRSEAMIALYAEGKYLDALNVTEQLALEFPDEASTTSLWRVCLLSRVGKTDEALKTMSEALGKGMWWSEAVLRADEDLMPLQGLPAYEAMVAECRTRKAAAQKDSKLEMLVRLPAGEPPYPLLIALHGRGGSPDRDVQYWEPLLQMGWMLAMPRSSQLGSPNMFVWDDAALAREEIGSECRRLLEGYRIDQERVILAGFSQGASAAIQISLGGVLPDRGFLAVAPGRMAMEEIEQLAHSAHGRRGYMIVGGRDPRHESLAQIHTLVNRNGVPCEMEDHSEMGHEFPNEFGRSITQALKFLLA